MNKRIPFLIGFIFLFLSVWMQVTTDEFVRSLITRLDNLAYDMQLRTRIFTHKTKVFSSSVAIVDIDDKSLQIEGRWPWPRARLATLIERLQDEGVVVVAMDMMFPEKEVNIVDTIQNLLTKRKLSTPDISSVLTQIQPELNNDLTFAKSMTGKDEVLGMTLLPGSEVNGTLPAPLLVLTRPEQAMDFITSKGYLSSISILQSAAKNAGFINVYADPDGIIRRVPIVMRYQNNLYPSLAFEAVRLYLLSSVKLDTAPYAGTLQLEGVRLGNHVIPTDSFGQVLIPFRGKSYTFSYYSATDVLEKKIPPNALAGKIVFLGTSATGLGDLRATAIQGAFPGVEIQATLADGILTDNFSYKPAWAIGAEIAITTLLGLCLVFIFPFLGPRSLTLACILIPAMLIFSNNWLWIKTGLIIFILIPILLTIILALMNMIYGYLFETRKRERIKEMFGQYVPEEHIDQMLKGSSNFALSGEDRDMTVLFADIRNFTSISEPMTASELKEMLNQFFTPMTQIIFEHKGTIDKYIGDLIMAFWGAPLKDKHHAQHAISAALEMQVAVEKLKPVFAERGWAEVNIGIGLNSGVMSVGDMGSQFRRNYTVLGDAVNLGSRVEGLTKYYGAKIMVAEATYKNQTKFIFRQLDRVRVKGKKLGIAIYEVIARSHNASHELVEEMKASDTAMDFYFNQQWDESLEIFQALHTTHPDAKFYKLYLERIAEFKQNPPPPDWDGVYVHVSK
jgi:adenylate cyclase